MQATEKSKYRFVINSLGEQFRIIDGEEDYTFGSLNVSVIAQQSLSSDDYEIWRQFDDNQPEFHVIDTFLTKCIDHEFVRSSYEHLSLQEFSFYTKVVELQAINNSRFRVWGELRENSFDDEHRRIWLVTEFCWWVDDEDFWNRLETLASEVGCEVDLMDERPHLDKRWKPGVNGYDGTNSNDDNAIYGEHHGRLERQVEFRQNVASMSLDEVNARIEELSEKTQAIWEQTGVGVI